MKQRCPFHFSTTGSMTQTEPSFFSIPPDGSLMSDPPFIYLFVFLKPGP